MPDRKEEAQDASRVRSCGAECPLPDSRENRVQGVCGIQNRHAQLANELSAIPARRLRRLASLETLWHLDLEVGPDDELIWTRPAPPLILKHWALAKRRGGGLLLPTWEALEPTREQAGDTAVAQRRATSVDQSRKLVRLQLLDVEVVEKVRRLLTVVSGRKDVGAEPRHLRERQLIVEP
jgi:hypothetical protein